MRRKPVNTPNGRRNIHYIKKSPGRAKCASCGNPLPGVPRGIPSAIAKIKRSLRRPDRPYGGRLCSSCTRNVMKNKNMERWEND